MHKHCRSQQQAYGNFFHRGSVSFPSTQKRRANLEWDQIRLCVWHDCSVFYFSTVGCHQEGLFTLGAEQREVFQYGILPDLGAGFAPAGRAQHPVDLFTLHGTASLPVMRHTGDLLQLEAVFLADIRVFFPVCPAKEHLQRADPQAAIPVQLAVDDTGHAAF